jgi:HK97 gp10 family phage protein
VAGSFQLIVVFNHIPEIIAYVEEHTPKVVEDSAQAVVNHAKETVPVVTGTLQSSIGYTASGKSAEIFASAEYAAFVEFGTYKMAAQPYLYPALQAEWPHFIKDVGDQVMAF